MKKYKFLFNIFYNYRVNNLVKGEISKLFDCD